MKYMKAVNFLYDFTLMYYLHDALFPISLHLEELKPKAEDMQHPLLIIQT